MKKTKSFASKRASKRALEAISNGAEQKRADMSNNE
jgi:hypothetical protein